MNSYYYDDYDGLPAEDTEELDDYDEHVPLWSFDDLKQSLGACLTPSLSQIGSYVLVLLGMTLLCRLSCLLLRRLRQASTIEWLQHGSSMLCGFIALYLTMRAEFLVVLCFVLLAYVLMLLLEYCQRSYQFSKGATVAVLTIGTHFAYETLWTAPEMWQRLRGIQMVASMKIISLAYDLEQTKAELPRVGLIPYLGFIFSPASCLLGPWLSYSAYARGLRASTFTVNQIFNCCLNTALAFLSLSLSNCVVPIVGTQLLNLDNWLWLRAYRDALAVRCSHYFICALSQASIALAGQASNDSQAFMGAVVTQPCQIEWPRSLHMLVRYWNIPMHTWLKKYVFRAALSRGAGNYLLALFSTYLVSALLHGLNLRIYLVLLTLAMFAYVENVLRAKLAHIFNACIAVNPCLRQECPYEYCPQRRDARSSYKWLVRLVNLCFSALAVFHLAYLGIMMDNPQADGMDMWQNWAPLNFASHWVALGTYTFYYLI